MMTTYSVNFVHQIQNVYIFFLKQHDQRMLWWFHTEWTQVLDFRLHTPIRSDPSFKVQQKKTYDALADGHELRFA